MIILRIPASGSPTVPSSGSASRSRSSLRLCSTVPPRLQLRRQLAPPTEPPTLLSCSYDRLAPMVRTFRLHLPPRRQLAPPNGLPILLSCRAVRLASHDRPSGLSFDRSVSFRLRLDLRFCIAVAVQLAPSPNRSASPSAPFISLRRELRFRICLPARVFSLRRFYEPFSLTFCLCRSACALD